MISLRPIRKSMSAAVWVATCALAVFFGLSPANASQTASPSSTPKKSTAKSHKTHKTAAKSASAKTSSTAKTHTASSKKSSRRKKSAKVRGQQIIDSDRAQAIQEALIREHYLSGEPTGTWNADSEAAMRRFQADNGWQSKTVPDSRALIKLGLGPSNDHLLNPESAMTTVPDRPKSNPIPPVSNSPGPVSNPASPSPAASPESSTPSPTSATTGSSDPQ